MNKKILFSLLVVAIVSCKDPRDKTVWDYINNKLATEAEFNRGVELLHADLIRHGYMKEHSCTSLGCTSAHQSTYADIERVRNISNAPAARKHTVLAKESIELDKQYSNSYFSLHYPSSWQVVQDDNQVTANTSIAVQIMEKQKNDVDFRPNINIIVSSKKWKESTSYIAQQSSQNNKQIVPSYKQLGISDTQISGCKGSLLEGTIELQGYKLRSSQYTVKKADNTTFIITITTDNGKHKKQMEIINAILKSIEIR